MAKSGKKARRAAPAKAGSRKQAARLWGFARPLLIIGLLALALFAGWYAVWQYVRPYVLDYQDYQVTPEQVVVTSTPPWIHSDIRREVFRNASLNGPLSVLDDDLTERIAHAFSLHPWVAKVHRVTKQHPARVEVELEYRRPACMVEVPGGLFPVDAQGVLLPVGDFSPVEASRYPRLAGVDTLPAGTVGEAWGDARVLGGAEIAAALADAWKELQLWQVRPADAATTGIVAEPTYELITRGGTHIFWGRAPGSNTAGELPSAEKVVRLLKYVREHGPLEGPNVPKRMDIQDMRVSARP